MTNPLRDLLAGLRRGSPSAAAFKVFCPSLLGKACHFAGDHYWWAG